MSKIEWTDVTWNPVTGCSKVSPGCKHCYAETLAARLQSMGNPSYENGFEVTTHQHMLRRPYRWRKPRKVFVCSMADLFHEKVPDAFLDRVFEAMRQNPRHTFQVLTKRVDRMALYAAEHDPWPANVWAGVSVEDQARADERIPELIRIPAAVRFLSCEPLLGPLRLEPGWIHDLQWVIVGGESGPGARPMHPKWPSAILEQLIQVDAALRHLAKKRGEKPGSTWTPLFFKQWGAWAPLTDAPLSDDLEIPGGDGQPFTIEWLRKNPRGHEFDDHEFMVRVGKKRAGRQFGGQTWDEFPKEAR